MQLIEMAKSNHRMLVTLPPHTIHRLQPLDVFGPLKANYNREIDIWMLVNPGKRVTDYDINNNVIVKLEVKKNRVH